MKVRPTMAWLANSEFLKVAPSRNSLGISLLHAKLEMRGAPLGMLVFWMHGAWKQVSGSVLTRALFDTEHDLPHTSTPRSTRGHV